MRNVELIVVDWDGGEGLMNCLHSIDVQTLPPDRVIVVDNGSTTSVYQRLPQNFMKVPCTVLRNETNLGFTGGINRAMKEVTAPFVGWVSNDVVLSEKWIEKLLPAASSEGKIAGVQSVNLRDKKTVDGAGISIDRGIFRQVGHGEALGRIRPPAAPWGIASTAALFRTHALQEAAVAGNVLRPDFFAYSEDVELCARLRERGWKFKVVPEALAMHRGSNSARRLGRGGFRMRVRNRYLVARAHPGVGKVSELIGEDLSLMMGDLGHTRFRDAFTRLGGVLEGLRRRAK